MTAPGAWHDRSLPRTVLFLARDPSASGLRILVYDNAPAEASALARLERENAGGSSVVVESAGSGPEAETALIDAWRELGPRAEHVWCAVGALAGVLLRVVSGPVTPVVHFGPSSDLLDDPNPRSRALLASAWPDSWSVALSAQPPVDAETWRKRLHATLDLGWRVAWTLDAGSRARGWLDDELTARQPRHGSGGAPAHVTLPGPAPAADDSSKVLHGRHGRLFLAKDTHDSHQQIVGNRPLTASELDAWERGTAERQARMAARGATFIQLLCPASQAVHAADLPAGTTLSPERPAMQLLRRLRPLSPPAWLYPLDELQRTAAIRDPFSTTDSHWNDLGAYIAYEHVMDQLNDAVAVRRVPRSGVSFHDTCFTGDLGEKVTPARASRFLRARVAGAYARLLTDNRVRNHGRQGEFACDAAPPSRCVVFGDSCAYPMLLFLAESFGRVVFRHRVNVVDDDLVDAERPDVVLVVLTERFAAALPDDRKARPFAVEVARKHKANALLPLPAPGEQPSLTFSIDPHREFPCGPGFHLPERKV